MENKKYPYFTIEGFDREEIFHLFTTRIGWEQNRLFDNLSELINIPKDKIYYAKQVHGKDILIIDENNLKNEDLRLKQRDGFITNLQDIALVTYHADCVPLYFFDKVNKVIGLAHSGWKGTYENIGGELISQMVDHYDSKVEDIIVGIGPAIGICCYEIGKYVRELFEKRYPNMLNIIVDKEEKTYLDLLEVNKQNLINSGINEKNIYYSNQCTSCNEEYFHSYRRDKGSPNRMLAVIGLR